ncbi:efflux RND transporter periplasmic adaptor subunit [Pelagicoccus sp. SDUM812005]|uniref:efflux RND transporter periplasmic adaptor subunit n=1 Tax=Pelagicoccus sp. SDUM812005 TaxID=3041257 RepID=UPI00280C89B2|nr:efflux RND transporter periplasmic adaptor subunit [Pelagicoccus sp. SDUM812005]MDQ8183545.1 efflux RND transporter periplasmic adaptor subunit [Pelagicoccus sp. SDUM812005]
MYPLSRFVRLRPLLAASFGLLVSSTLLAETRWVEGISQPMERITVSSPVEEIVKTVSVTEGDEVEAGQVLAELLSSQERLEVERLEVLIEKAEVDFKATADLVAERIESEDKLVEARTTLQSLKIEREIALNDVEERIIRSPIAGVVVFRLKDPGEAIGRVEPLFEVIKSDQLKLQFFMSATDLPALQVGGEAEVQFPIAKPGESFSARLDFVDPQIDSRSGLFRVRYVFDNTQAGVKPGARVQVKLELGDQ